MNQIRIYVCIKVPKPTRESLILHTKPLNEELRRIKLDEKYQIEINDKVYRIIFNDGYWIEYSDRYYPLKEHFSLKEYRNKRLNQLGI